MNCCHLAMRLSREAEEEDCGELDDLARCLAVLAAAVDEDHVEKAGVLLHEFAY